MDAAALKFADDFGADVDMDGVDDLELGEEQSGARAAFVSDINRMCGPGTQAAPGMLWQSAGYATQS
jgi:hypothetical protein